MSGRTRAGRRIRRVDPLTKGAACESCKQRRVKCDGAVPACGACVRLARWEGRNEQTRHGCCYPGQRKQSPDGSSGSPALTPASPIDILSPQASTSTLPGPARSTSREGRDAKAGPVPKGLACIECRQRKVRCDLARPACKSCTRKAKWEGTAPCCTWRDELAEVKFRQEEEEQRRTRELKESEAEAEVDADMAAGVAAEGEAIGAEDDEDEAEDDGGEGSGFVEPLSISGILPPLPPLPVALEPARTPTPLASFASISIPHFSIPVEPTPTALPHHPAIDFATLQHRPELSPLPSPSTSISGSFTASSIHTPQFQHTHLPSYLNYPPVPYPRRSEEDCFWAAQSSTLSLGQLEGWSLDGAAFGESEMGMDGLRWEPKAGQSFEAQIEDEVMASFGLSSSSLKGAGGDERMVSVKEEDELLPEFVAGNLF